ncbi:Dynamin family protein [Penicillium riverlandense]|uniref:Dynamin family protein n=1 Tax=Penicillium riverlandense TaxID=1903569 RepID=UPI002546EC65|nr:Dynamin family protein [Penicillium riverlandense]KAJ5825622.1 Dynamin family protein [Penicillium riverlandense]
MPYPNALPCMARATLDLLSLDMKDLVKKIQALSHLGIEDSKIALPKICVVGGQSAGKSSLIEGISEIRVPRSAGTCTRCPLEINLSESEPGQPWKCDVYLSQRYFYDPDRKLTKLPRRSEPLGPWTLMGGAQEDILFVTLSDKGEVEDALVWAQLATLNPSSDSLDYAPGRNENTSREILVKFSPNVIRLDISSPGFPNLSFYDLPGVISQPEHDGEEYLVKLVENLVKQYVSQENCIVLLAVTMTDDATNSSAARLVREIRGANDRTLGVLTKPDQVPPGGDSFQQWTEILAGLKFKVGYGYFVVRNNPNPAVGHAQARVEEELFFADGLWAQDLYMYRHRFGTKKLQSALSDLLLKQIKKCLPSIIAKIRDKEATIDTELSTLPACIIENVQSIIYQKRCELLEKLRANVDGGSGISEYSLQKRWNQVVNDFQRALVKTRPTVLLPAISDKESLTQDSDCVILDGPGPTPKKRKVSMPQPRSPEANPSPAVNVLMSGYELSYFSPWDGPAKKFTWEGIRDIKDDFCSAGMPNQIDPRAIETLQRVSIEHWEGLMQRFVDATNTEVQKALLDMVEEVFNDYHQTGLYREVKSTIISYLAQLKCEHLAYGREVYKMENGKPFTRAIDQLNKAQKAALKELTRARFLARGKGYLELRGYQFSSINEASPVVNSKLSIEDLGPDPFAQEVEMMARARAYYDVASSRFLDVVGQSVHMKLFSKCRNELVGAIDAQLKIFGPNSFDRCLELMAEDPERQHRRNYLQKEHEKVKKALAWLDTFHNTEDEDTDNTLFVEQGDYKMDYLE